MTYYNKIPSLDFLFIEISGLSVFICIFVVFKRRIVDRILL